jgi:5'-deoxynucleotidase YfbR-like HD superfamily hydrolase
VNFLFRLPELEGELSEKARDVIYMASLAERLAEEQRKRVAHPSGRPENVSEHSLMLVKVAVALAQKYYPELDSGKVAQYAACHDDVEAYVGDTPTGEWCNTDYEAKESLEAKGLAQLEQDFSAFFPKYVETIKIYERQKDAESRFVRMVDKVLCTAIQVTDGGQEANRHFTKEAFVSNEQHRLEKHKTQYVDWQEVLELQREIAQYVARYLFGKSNAAITHGQKEA